MDHTPMFLPLAEQLIAWQSDDGNTLAGSGRLGETAVDFAWLGERPAVLSDVQGLLGFLKGLREIRPLLLLSACPGFAPDLEAERNGLVFYAAQYRQLQNQRRDAGCKTVSVIHKVATGGPYLMHGLSATVRLATPGIRFYGALPLQYGQQVLGEAPPEADESGLQQALAYGLIH